MPLKLSLRRNEKVIINGVVVENIGDAATILVHNRGQLLRSKDILTLEDAVTPAARAYYSLQCLYLFPEKADVYRPAAEQFLADFAAAVATSVPIVDEIRTNVDKGDIYQALRAARRLIDHEREVLSHVA
jgi:flagellar protein FlbT